MKLQKIRVTKYKCVNDSNEFDVEDKATCLVGKNESGKTTLLLSLSKLNSYDPSVTQYSDLECPRTLMTDFEKYADENPLFTKWELSSSEVAGLVKVFGPAAESAKHVVITKNYRNNVSIKLEQQLNEGQVIQFILAAAKLSQDELAPLQSATGVADLFRIVATRPEPVKTAFAGQRAVFENKALEEVAADLIKSQLPKFAYFAEYLRMPGQLSLNALKQHIQTPAQLTGGDKVFLALLDMIGSKLEDLEKTNQFERLQARLEAASNTLTNEIFAYWTQNRHLKVQFRFEQALPGDVAPFNSGFVLRTRIENTRHGVTTSFDDRSAGFVWFFSFLIWFSQVKKNYGDKIILLLDEPGLTLHASAQQDLLRFFREKLTPNFQLIYTTHSPFLIEPANLLSTRTVEDVFIETKAGAAPPDENSLGTKVRADVLATEKETLFPLQACLGYDITQTLFIGKNSLLVEGPSDLLYLRWFSARLRESGRTGLDAKWTIVPCEGLTKIGSFIALFGGNQLNLVVLCDYSHGTKKTVKTLKESKLLASGAVLSADTYAGKVEADLEDVIGNTNFLALVNACYASHLKAPTSPPSNAAGRILSHVEDAFRLLLPPTPEFDHYTPAEFLIRNESKLTLPELPTALDRFEQVFKDINAFVKD
jgi:predicted ATP-dependent endonuclease of OLD family